MSQEQETDSDEDTDIEPVHYRVPRRSCWYWYERRKRYVHVNFNKKVRVQEQIYLCDQKRYRYSRSSSLDLNDNHTLSIHSPEPTSDEELAKEEEKTNLDIHKTLWFTKILPELEKKFPEEYLIISFGNNYKEYNERVARIIAHVRKEESEYNLDDDLREEKIPQSMQEAEKQAIVESVEDAVVSLATES